MIVFLFFSLLIPGSGYYEKKATLDFTILNTSKTKGSFVTML
jgi:hypothetical protein